MLDAGFLGQLITVTLTETFFPDTGAAVALLLGTAAVESGLWNIQQGNGGPARGVFQLEPRTAREHDAWLRRQEHGLLECRAGIRAYSLAALEKSLVYQILLARTHYYRRDANPLPAPEDIATAAATWKAVYNTRQGKGTEAAYLNAWERLIAPNLEKGIL